jgi:high-affinity iron transporter
MRRILVAISLVAACGRAPDPSKPPPAHEDVRRLSSILDYVAADYPVAVKDGAILDEGEYQEQLAFLRDAAALAAQIPPSQVDARAEIARTAALVEGRADPAQVAEAARGLRRRLLDAHGIVLAPAAPPDRARAAALYAQSCASCHGPNGAADGPQARGLDPPPRSFVDPAVLAELTPTRAFNALTDGIRGTAMPSWGGLSPSDRWALAFHVFGFRHDAEAARRGADLAPPLTAPQLANLSDGELLASLGDLDERARGDALAYLRTVAPFAAGGASLAGARRDVGRALAAYRAGNAGDARQTVAAAYLDGFEPHEGALRARDADLVRRAEEGFLALREAMSAGAPLASVEAQALELQALLERADSALGGGGAGIAFASSLVVILREGVEAALLILLLLGLARRAAAPEHAPGDARAVHAGWLLAAGVGVITWFASGPLVDAVGGARRELIEGIVALLAAAVLLATGHFVLARLDARHRVEAIKRRLAEAGAGTRRRIVLVGLAFVAVYREAFEVVLFLRAIALDASAPTGAVAAGAAAGALLLVGVVALLMRLGRRLSPGPLLATMGTLLCVLAVVLAGKGIRALQEAGVLSIRPLDVPRIDWLGVFPTLQGVAAQLLVLGTFALIALLALRARRAPA